MPRKIKNTNPVFFETLRTSVDPAADWFKAIDRRLDAVGHSVIRALDASLQWGREASKAAAGWLGVEAMPAAAQAAKQAAGWASSATTWARYSTGWTLRHSFSRRAFVTYVIVLSLALVATIATMAVVGMQTLSAYASDLANPSTIINFKNTGTTLLDRNGKILYKVYGAPDRSLITYEEVPDNLKKATLAAEDPGFYQHPAFSWKGTGRALLTDITDRSKTEGGSTITQQLVKSSLLTPQKSYTRKFKEILLAMAVEKKYSKDQVLTMYLNQVYYGQGAYGAANAAKVYFHKPLNELTIGESAMIAGLPLGPSRFDPTFDHASALERRNYVIGEMAQHNLITSQEAETAKAEPLVAYQQNITINAPHFVFYVLDQLRLRYGDELVEHGGITVTTTLDLNKQDLAQEVAAKQINRLAANHVTNAGLVSLDPKNGQILAMLGSVNYNNPDWGNVNVTESELQPGSSFKPIAYVTAFSKGWNGATTVDDSPSSFPGGNGTVYKPVNYDGKFRGTVTLRRALANSLNIPAVKVLQYAGLPDTLSMAHRLGISSLNDPERYGLSLVLGGGEVKPLDMATVYGTFAAGGIKHSPQAILKVADRDGHDITKQDEAGESVLDPRLAYMITNILSDNQARVEEFGANNPLQLSRPAAAKTGTTNDFRDNWTVGYTPDLVTAVWVGNNDHTPMNSINGITGAAPIWHDYMEGALKGTAVDNFTQPSGVVLAKVCSYNGGLVNPWDSSGYNEVFLTEHQQTKRCNSPKPKPKEDKPPDENNGSQPNPDQIDQGGGVIVPEQKPKHGQGQPDPFFGN